MKVLGRYRMRKAFTTLIEGRKIESVKRRGLFLTVVLSGDRTMVIELGSGAVLRRHANKDPVVRYTELVITFTQQGQLRLVDPDGSSDVFAVDTDALKDELPQLEGYGFDPISNQVPWEDLWPATPFETGEVEDLVDGPHVHYRHRQHLCRRNPL